MTRLKNIAKENHMTQCERLHDYLQNHTSINPLEAWRQLGIYRLAPRINDLRKKGLRITTDRVTVINHFNEPVTVASYTLEEEIWPDDTGSHLKKAAPATE